MSEEVNTPASQASEIMYGLEELKKDGVSLGYIEEDSFEWGGAGGEVTEIKAAQKPNYPVLVIPKSNGTQKPTFNLIQLSFENLQKILGGTLKKTGENITGWSAPSKILAITGKFTIDTANKKRITISRALVQGFIDGGLNLTGVSKIKCTLSIMEPEQGEDPFSVDDIADEIGNPVE